MRYQQQPVALVGSHIANGDLITSSPNSTIQIRQFLDEPPTIQGLLDPNYQVAA